MKAKSDRRNFIKLAAAGIAAAALTEKARAEDGKATLKKAVALGMIQDKATTTLLDKFKLAKELGFEGIELNSHEGFDKDEVLKALEATGLGISEVVDNRHWKDLLSSPSEEVRARGVAALRQALEEAKAYTSTAVLLVPGQVNENVSYDLAYERSQAEIRKVIPYAQELGVKINIENVWNNFLLSPLEMKRYIDEFQSPWVGVHFDVGNIINYGWADQWIRILGKRIERLHIKEFSRSKRDKEGTWKGFDVKIGDGDCKWPAVMKALTEIGYSGWATAEVSGGDRTVLKDISERMDKVLRV